MCFLCYAYYYYVIYFYFNLLLCLQFLFLKLFLLIDYLLFIISYFFILLVIYLVFSLCFVKCMLFTIAIYFYDLVIILYISWSTNGWFNRAEHLRPVSERHANGSWHSERDDNVDHMARPKRACFIFYFKQRHCGTKTCGRKRNTHRHVHMNDSTHHTLHQHLQV